MRKTGSWATWALIVMVASAFGLAACGGGSGAMRRNKDGKLVPTLAGQDPASTLYAATVQKAEQGRCDEETMNVLTCFAYRGHGYEGAQAGLGQCLLRNGDKAAGIEWITRAANAGWADAQEDLALLYADKASNAPSAKVEGAFWARLYTRNASLLSLGVTPNPEVTDKYRGKLTSAEAQTVQNRVDSWIPRYWTPETKPDQDILASCRVENRPRPAPSLDDLNQGTNPTNPY